MLRIEGDKKTFNEAVRIYEETHSNAHIDVTHQDLEVVKEALGPNPGMDKFLTYLKVLCEEGLADVTKAGNSNGMWKEWNPSSVKSVFSKI